MSKRAERLRREVACLEQALAQRVPFTNTDPHAMALVCSIRLREGMLARMQPKPATRPPQVTFIIVDEAEELGRLGII